MSAPALATRPKTPPPAFNAEELANIRQAVAEVASIEARLLPLTDHRAIRELLAEMPDAYGRGEVCLATAIYGSLTSDAPTSDVISSLRAGCKRQLKAVYQPLRDLIARADAHRLAALAELAAKLQAVEMENAAQLGIENDNFQPSDLLNSLRETLSRETAEVSVLPQEVRRGDFSRLVAAIADLPDPAPTKPAKRSPLEMETLLTDDELC